MKKWETMLFGGGGGSSAQAYEDQYDPDPGNDMIDIKIGNTTYSFPQKLFDNVGEYNAKNNANKGYVAAVYAAYRAATGKDPYDVAKEQHGAVEDVQFTGVQFSVDNKDYELNDYILNTILTDWVASQGGTFIVPEGYSQNNLNELHANNKSFQKGIDAALNSGAVTVNGKAYDEWYATQPQFTEGYSAEYGAAVGKTTNGDYVYPNAEGDYTTGTGAEITDFTGITDLQGNSLVVDTNTGALVDETTGNPVVQPTAPEVKVSPVEDAYNKYYQDLFSQKEGTLGKQILDNNTALYEKEADNAATLAAASVQSQALAQAQGVKQVTDQIRAERLAQLRAGMSESQLADRELSMLVGSVNQFTNQGAVANQEAMAAELAKSTARETAFNDYITQTTALGQNAAANYASQAGDIMSQAFAYQQRMAAEGKRVTIDDAITAVSGNKAS